MNEKVVLDYSKVINYLILVYAFVLPLSRSGISIVTALLVIVWLLQGNLSYKFSILKSNRVVVSIAIFLVFNIFSLLWSNSPVDGLKFMARYWYLLPIMVLFTSLKKEFIYKTITAFIVGMFISEMLSYGIFFELIQMKHGTPSDPTPFMHHLDYSVFLSFTSILILDRILHLKELKQKLIYAFFFLSVTANLFITGGRSGQLAFFLVLFVLFIIRFDNRVKAFFIALLTSLSIFILAITFSNTFHAKVNQTLDSLNGIVQTQNYCTSIGMRAGSLIIAKDIIVEHPLLGIGIIDNMDKLREKIDEEYTSMKCLRWYMHYHNQYAQILTQTGVIGLIIFLLIFYNILKLSYINFEFTIIKILLVSIFLIGFSGDPILHKQFTMALFALFVGILNAQHRIENEA